MTADDLRAIMNHLRQCVRLGPGPGLTIEFHAPDVQDLIDASLDEHGSRQVRSAPWFDDMVADIIETPELCEPDDTPEQILEYARDVVSEYIRKRAAL